MDVIWLSSVGSIWGEKSENKLWEELHGIHSFAIIFSVVNIFTKVLNIIFLLQPLITSYFKFIGRINISFIHV